MVMMGLGMGMMGVMMVMGDRVNMVMVMVVVLIVGGDGGIGGGGSNGDDDHTFGAPQALEIPPKPSQKDGFVQYVFHCVPFLSKCAIPLRLHIPLRIQLKLWAVFPEKCV